MTRLALPRGVVALGMVSLFMDTSSELIHSLLPVFLVTVLGASALTLGLILCRRIVRGRRLSGALVGER